MATPFIITLFIVLIGPTPLTALAAGKCSAAMLGKAQKEVSQSMKSLEKSEAPWTALRNSFSGRRECMRIYETYDFGEAIRKIFLKNWKALPEFKELKDKDPGFYRFALSALEDETANQKDIKSIADLAINNCPKDLGPTCTELQRVANSSSGFESILQKESKYEEFVTPNSDDFISEIESKDRKTELRLDVNGDKLEDSVLLLFSKTQKKSAALLLLRKKEGFESPIELYSSALGGPRTDKVDMSIEAKVPMTPGISDRMYFSSDSEKDKAFYKASAAIEVSYNEYYCTKGYYFSKNKLKNAEACD
jgi:hypothetical protein